MAEPVVEGMNLPALASAVPTTAPDEGEQR